MGRVDGYNPPNNKIDIAFSWTDVYEKETTPTLASGNFLVKMTPFVSCG